MIELNDNFSLADLGNVKKEAFEILYNKNRVSSWEGHLYITPDKVYFIVDSTSMNGRSIVDIGGAPKSWYGNVLRFSNVFRKTRNQITEALDNRLGK